MSRSSRVNISKANSVLLGIAPAVYFASFGADAHFLWVRRTIGSCILNARAYGVTRMRPELEDAHRRVDYCSFEDAGDVVPRALALASVDAVYACRGANARTGEEVIESESMEE